jgi:hypothetical protein
MNFISEKPSWRERVALGRIAPSTLCVSAARLRCSSRDLTWVTLSQSEEVIFGQRRPDSLAIDWNNKMVCVLEFKRTSDQRRDYREKGEARARAQHDVLIRSLSAHARDRVVMRRIDPLTLCVSAVCPRCSSRDLTWVTLSHLLVQQCP